MRLHPLMGLACLTALQVAAPAIEPRHGKPAPKPSGKPIPEGTVTRQQRRAAERARIKAEKRKW